MDTFKNYEVEICPLCGGEMIIKLGRYGYFWSCVRFPKCKGAKSIDRLRNLKLIYLDFYEPESFVYSEAFKKIKSICHSESVPEYIKPLPEIIEAGYFYKGVVDVDGIRGMVSGLLDYLCKNEYRFLLAQFSYFIYKVELEELPKRFDYFLNMLYKQNSIESVVKHKEYQITKAIVEGWERTPFYRLFGLKLVGEEVSLRQIVNIDSSCKIDIVAKNESGDIALMEVKRAYTKSKNAWGQLHVYSEMVREHGIKVAGYIITSGYPRGIVNKNIGLIGYTIEGENLALIPWRNAAFV